MNLSQKITIGITTKDRWDELSITIRKLVALGLGEIPMIVVDDGSVEAKAKEVCKSLMNCTVIREPVSLGLVEERNNIARLTRTDYVVSLDDDSCFESCAGLADAVEFMDTHPHVFCLAFHICCANGRIQYPLEGYVKEYSGCGHLMRTGTFLKLGGYDGSFVHMCEERDLSMRAYEAGYVIHAFPKVTVNHRVTQSNRSSRRVSFYSARNTIGCQIRHAPSFCLPSRLLRASLGQMYSCLRRKRVFFSTVQGLVSGLSCKHFWKTRSPMPLRTWTRYMSGNTPLIGYS